MPVPLLALVPMIISIGGRTFVQMVAKKGVKSLVKKGFKKLTKKNFKKTYDFFEGDKLLKLGDKNKILKSLKIRIPKPKIDKKAVAEGAKLVKDITKQTKTGKVLEQTKKIFAPSLYSKRGLVQYPAYYFGGKKILERDAAIKEAEKKSLKEEKQKTEIKEKKELYEAKKKETTLGEIDLNTIAVPDGHIWKTDPKGDFIIP